ncbi:hypothetical protein OIO90_006079 [Microbotryomycetes sp. JL221]|nr:hypothetical protein OIO90_006079 [Microbotryomycetes sp. JL221]
MTADINEEQLTIETVEMLHALARDLVAQRLAHADQLGPDAPFDATPIVTAATPMFAALNCVNRQVQLGARSFKARTHEARLVAEQAHLRLQNLLFEQNHLEHEIRRCKQYESEFQNLPLHELGELQQLASQTAPPEGLVVPLPEDAHELMLARLAFELAERTRFDREKKELGASKSKLVKDNNVKKAKLEGLEAQVEDFVNAAKAIQSKMHDDSSSKAVDVAIASEQTVDQPLE